MNFFKILYLLITVPVGILVTRIKEIKTGKRIPSLFTDLEKGVRENGNRMYYVVRKYNNSEEKVLTQYVDFYLPIGSEFRNVTIDVVDFIRLQDRVKKLSLHKGSTYGTLKLQDMDIYFLSKVIDEKFNKQVNLVRIDKDVVNC